MTLTIRQTQQVIRQMGMACKYSPEYREFQLGGYFTEDRSDAIWTAAVMLNDRENIPESSRQEVARGRVMRALTLLNLRA